MTHSLHRQGAVEDLLEDFVMLFLLSRIKPRGTLETIKQIWEVLSSYEHHLVNFGTPNPNRDGGELHNLEQLRKSADSRMIMAVFKDRETLTNCLREIKERKFGISLVISGLYKETGKICAETSLSPHTVNLSLGIHGNISRTARRKCSRDTYHVWACHGLFKAYSPHGRTDQEEKNDL